MIHHKALEHMKAKTLSALQGCTVSNRWPEFASYSENVLKLSNEVVRNKGEWLTSLNVYSIFLSEVTSVLSSSFPDEKELSGKLTDILNDAAVNSLADKIVATITSVPRSYVFYFPLPNVQIPIKGMIQLGDGVFLKRFEKGEEAPGKKGKGLLGIFSNRLDREIIYLCIDGSGFTSGDTDDIAFNHALSQFKILTHLLNIRGLFNMRSVSPRLYGLGGEGHYVPNLFSVVFDTEKPKEPYATSLLPLGISRYTDKLTFNDENKHYQKAIAGGHDSIATFIQAFTKHPTLLLRHKGADSVPIRSAIEWAYEASTTDNDTIAFIQVCIGLEAILGDDITNESISSTLADRCAFLLGEDIQGRRTIREKFKQVYKRRSKLAHGRVIRLQHDELEYFNWAKSVLNYLIQIEMKHLNLGNKQTEMQSK